MVGDEPVKIVGVIVGEVTMPTEDGTKGSALYTVPLQLSRQPSSEWRMFFENAWENPPRSTTIHKPGIVTVVLDRIVLEGTTMEKVEQDHLETLKLCVDRANEEETQYLQRKGEEEGKKQIREREHIEKVKEIANRLDFDE